MSRNVARELRSHRPVGTVFGVTGSDLANLGGAFSGSVVLATSGEGRPITAPWVAPGYRIGVLGDSMVPALLAIRALAAGAAVAVVTMSPGAWQHLGHVLGRGARLHVLDTADAAQLDGVAADLVISDMPYGYDWVADGWNDRAALVSVMAAPGERSVPLLRRCQLVAVTSEALPAPTGSVAAALLGPEYSGLRLPKEKAFLWGDGLVHEIVWRPSELEAQALGMR